MIKVPASYKMPDAWDAPSVYHAPTGDIRLGTVVRTGGDVGVVTGMRPALRNLSDFSGVERVAARVRLFRTGEEYVTYAHTLEIVDDIQGR